MNLDVSVARFAPMRRLLSGEDEDYLTRQGFRREAARVRTQHRRMFFRFVDMLQKDFASAHAARKAAMTENWDFETLIRARFAATYYLWLMRTAGMMHFLHVPQAARVVHSYFDRAQEVIREGSPVPLS